MFERVREARQQRREDAPLLTRRFLLRSGIAFLVIGVLVHVVVGRQVEARYQSFAEFHAEFVAESLLKQELAEADALAAAPNEQELDELHDFVDEYVMVGDVLRLKVWAEDGTIVLSDDRSLVGGTTPAQQAHIAEVLENGIETEREEESAPGDVGAVRQTIETYVPIWVDGDGAVVEVYQDLEPTIAAARNFTHILDVILVVGLGGLWVLLIPLMRRAARRLQRQKIELGRLLSQEKDTVAKLQQINEMKDTILSAVSHELRTPLTVLKSGSETLRHYGEQLSPELRSDLLERVGRNADRLESLLGSLLDLDRLTRGTIEPQSQPTPLEPLVLRVLEVMPSTRRINVDIPDVTVHADPSQLERIVENLAFNALRHTPESANIAIRAELLGDRVVLRVDDSGRGVPEDLREAVFEPFVQGEALHPESPGTGVGLALVRRFTDLNGGRAWVEESESGGASFRVELPRASVESARGGAVDSDDPQATAEPAYADA